MLEADLLQITTTADGSPTLRHLGLDVLYRSDQGALGESEHVFLRGTRLLERPTPWRVLELGFGTGLNFLATAQEAINRGIKLDYYTLDAAPIPPQFATPGLTIDAELMELLHQVRERQTSACLERDSVRLTLYPFRWQETELDIETVNSVFHDPFAPSINPDCWTREAFEWSRKHIRSDGLLATYSAAGHVRRAMRDAGYVVARAPGFGKKREMTLASPGEAHLAPHPIKYRP